MNAVAAFVGTLLVVLPFSLLNAQALVGAQPESTSRATTAPASQPARSDQLNAQLQKKLPGVKNAELSVADLLDFVRDSGPPVFVVWESLEACGIDRSMTLAIRVEDPTAGELLDLIVTKMNEAVQPMPDGAHNRVCAITDENVFVIVAEKEAHRYAELKARIDEQAWDEQTIALLNAPARSLRLDAEMLWPVAKLRMLEQTGLDLFIDFTALNQIGIDEKTRISLRLQGLTARELLAALLIQIDLSGRAIAIPRDGRVVITTRQPPQEVQR